METDYSRSIVKIIHECLRFNRESIEKTKEFKKFKHNKHLCPLLEEKLNLILDYFNRYRNLAYDIQGFNDEGSDVILYLNKDDNQKTICFQIKSHSELMAGKDIITKIGFQYAQSMKNYDPLEYYLIPCCYPNEKISKSQTLTDRLRNIRSEFSGYDRMTIIDPVEFAYFSRLSSEHIGTIIKLILEPDDVIYRKCLESIQELDKVQRYTYLRTLVLFVNNNFMPIEREIVVNDPAIVDYITENRILFYSKNSNYSLPKDYKGKYDLLAYYILETLDQKFVFLENGHVNIESSTIQHLIAFILDSKIRCNFNDNELINFLKDIFITQYT